MPVSLETLTARDFPAAMTLLRRAFTEHGETDFASLLPALYQPTDAHMGRQLALRDDGRLVALLGLFPIDWRVGGAVLKVAGIGGVSVDPECRGRGLMRRLMEHARARIAEQGYALSYLGGQRQLYRRFGWEAAGCRVRLGVSVKNLASLEPRAPTVELSPLEAAEVAELEALHRTQPIRCARPTDDFAGFLHGWRHEPLVARADGRVTGYLVHHPGERVVYELVASSPDVAVEMVRAYVRHPDRPCTVVLGSEPSGVLERLGGAAETIGVEHSGNWQVLDWARVAGALLAFRHALDPRPAGEVVLRSESQTFRLWVDASGAGASPCSAPPSLILDGPTLTRLLFGPLSPGQVTTLSAAATALSAWCPLPLALPRQDQV